MLFSILAAALISLLFAAHYHHAFGQQECHEDVAEILPPHIIDNVVPKTYDLSLTIDMDTDDYSGTVSIAIDFDPKAAYDDEDLEYYIYLHVYPDLEIVQWRTLLQNEAKEIITIESECRHTRNEYWVIELDSPLSKGKYTLTLEFKGNMKNPRLVGLYKYGYVDAMNNEIANLAYTMLHRTNARMLFPCFDEPRFKSEFKIQIKHQSRYNARTNIEITNTEEAEEGWTVSHFHSPGILTPAWLVGININQFTETLKTENGIEIRLWSRPELSDAQEFTLNFAARSLQFYNDYFIQPYPMKQINLVGLPTQAFSFFGMEQWSLISIIEPRLLWKEGESTVESMFETVCTVAHELSHQWFANRVSIRHWKDEWLNEGFATWEQYKAVDAVEPDWKFSDERLIFAATNAFVMDSMDNSEALVPNVIWYKVGTPDARILYYKGAAILFMIEDHMGRKFKKAVRQYISDHNQGTATTDDLWKSFQKVIKKRSDVASVYNNWVRRPGYPVVGVRREENRVVLTQQRFLAFSTVDAGILWSIPLTYYLKGKREFKLFSEKTLIIEGIPKEEPLLFNINHLGYYITWYEDWSQVSSVVGSTYLSDLDYAGLMLDLYFLTTFKGVPYSQVTGLMGRILNATDHAVTWKMSAYLILDVYKYMKTREDTYRRFADLLLSWVQGKYRSDLWNESGKSIPQIRFAVHIIDIACNFALPKCLEDAKKLFDDWRDNGTKLTPNIRSLVYNYGLKASNDVADLDYVWKQYKEAEDTPLVPFKTQLKNSLCYVRNVDLVNRYFELVKNELPNINFLDFMASIANNPDAVDIAWNKFCEEFFRLRQLLSNDVMGNVIVTFARQFADDSKLKVVDNKIDVFGQVFQNTKSVAASYIAGNLQWINRHGTEFARPEQ